MTEKETVKSLPKNAKARDAKVEKLKKQLAELLELKFENELEKIISESNVVATIKSIKEKVNGITDIELLEAICKAADIKKVVISKKQVVARKNKEKSSTNRKSKTAANGTAETIANDAADTTAYAITETTTHFSTETNANGITETTTSWGTTTESY